MSHKILTKTELRSIALNILLNNSNPPNQFANFELQVAGSAGRNPPGFHGEEWLLFREVFSDLILDKIITIGKDQANCDLPWFRLHSEALENFMRLEQA